MDVDSAEEFVKPVELCLVDMKRYADNSGYKSHGNRGTHNDGSYNIEYKYHEERCATDVEFKYKQKPEQENGVK